MAYILDKTKLIGARFGQVTVIGDGGSRVVIDKRTGLQVARIPLWLCRCDCGNEFSVANQHLVKKGDGYGCRSCVSRREARKVGLANKTHGLTDDPIYAAWKNMIARCTKPDANGYESYGGRGITVCDSWLGPDGLDNFVRDMGTRPPRHEIDRIDVNGNYCPENCKWSTKQEQARNTRKNRCITANGETLTVTEWAERLGVTASAINGRLASGWTPEQIVSVPVGVRRKKLRTLDAPARAALLADYENGVTVKALGDRHGLNKYECHRELRLARFERDQSVKT